MLADGKAEDVGGFGELEAVATYVRPALDSWVSNVHGSVVRQDGLLLELELLELSGLEHLS